MTSRWRHQRAKARKVLAVLFATFLAAVELDAVENSLEAGWQNPPNDARLRAYWWWLNGNVDKVSITHDLEQMKAKGFGGAVIFDANGATQGGNAAVLHGPTFFSPAWRELYKHTLREADRLGLEISLNIQSGWNLGGPWVTKDDAAKKYIWSETEICGGTNLAVKLPLPKSRENFYRDTAIVAYRIKKFAKHEPLKNWKQKALQQSLEPFSTPDSSPLFTEIPSTPGEEDVNASDVLDLTTKLEADGTFKWCAPSGDWQVFRFGYTISDHAYVSTGSDGWQRAPGASHDSFALDVYDKAAFENYWNAIVAPLIADAETVAGENTNLSLATHHSSLRYLHTDSWEIELANWTPTIRDEFQKRHGYDLTPWLPVLAGRIVTSREESDRFLFDYRQTLGDLAIDNHYKPFRDNAHAHGLGIHPESGGPHAVPIDAQRCLGMDDAPMSEFWGWSWTHRIGDANRFFVKQPASAAHTYGHKFVFAEGFTTIGPHWQEKIWENLKPAFDKALCEGLNVLVWHAFVNSPAEMGFPGQQYFAGTHMNPQVTWWEKSMPFLNYIDRCQFLLQQGNFNADVLYYYGDHVPNFAQYKATDPAHCEPGYDYDVITAEALINRATVNDGKIFLPDGTNYRILVLPDHDMISLPVLKKIKELVLAGATVIGPKPRRGETLGNFAATDAEVQKIAGELWGGATGKGRVIIGKTSREVLLADGVRPDCEFIKANDLSLDYIHRTSGDAEIYFIANRTNFAAAAMVAFRVAGKVPELWNAVTGEHKFAAAYEEKEGRVYVPLDFAPCGSWFVVFSKPSSLHPPIAKTNSERLSKMSEISGAWTVHFDPKWGGPENVQFDSLVSWPTRPEPGIKFYSGTAVYEKTFGVFDPQLMTKNSALFLDLGDVHEIAEVKVNGKSCGTVWSPPWRVDVTDAVKIGENKLQIEVVNFWPNRVIGDAGLPKDKRFTRTNIRELTESTPLMESGLFGPVRLWLSN